MASGIAPGAGPSLAAGAALALAESLHSFPFEAVRFFHFFESRHGGARSPLFAQQAIGRGDGLQPKHDRHAQQHFFRGYLRPYLSLSGSAAENDLRSALLLRRIAPDRARLESRVEKLSTLKEILRHRHWRQSGAWFDFVLHRDGAGCWFGVPAPAR